MKLPNQTKRLPTLGFLTALAFVLTVALTFASIEIPRILAILLRGVPDVNPGIDPEFVKEFMKIARPIG